MLWANDSRAEAKRMLLNEVEMLCFLSVSPEFCPSARVVSVQASCRVKEKWLLYCSFSSVCGNLSARYQSLKCLAVVLPWKHDTAKINSGASQRKDRRINTSSKMAITFLILKNLLLVHRQEKEREMMAFLWVGTREDFSFIFDRKRAAFSKVQHKWEHL